MIKMCQEYYQLNVFLMQNFTFFQSHFNWGFTINNETSTTEELSIFESELSDRNELKKPRI